MNFINSWLRSDIQTIDAYYVPESTGMIKLDAMESPFALPELNTELTQKYLTHLADTPLNRYPNPNLNSLHQTLRTLMDIPDELGVLLGNGSDELIQLLALGCEANDTILSLEPSFVMYKMIAKFTHLHYQGVALDDNFEIDLPATLLAIKTHFPKIIFIAHPNNPTGNAFNRKMIEDIIQSTTALVVLDEAYYAYMSDNFLADISRYPNLVVLRTVSKIGFAGLRLGLLIGSQSTVSQLDKLRLPYNINALTQVSANFLLQQKSQIHRNGDIIIAQRQILTTALKSINALKVYPSQANFILFKTPDANALFAHLKKQNVLVKNLTNTPKLNNCLRVTIGNIEQNQQFINIVQDFYG